MQCSYIQELWSQIQERTRVTKPHNRPCHSQKRKKKKKKKFKLFVKHIFGRFKDVRWLQLFIQTFFLTSLFRFRNI